jgi:acyl-CoA thioesterase FadM
MSPAGIRRRRTIEFADTDASGRAHFTALLRHVEAVEHEWLRELGLPVLDARGGWPRVRVECDFRAPLAAGDEVEVFVGVEDVGGSSVVWSFGIFSPDGGTAAEGRMTTVWVGADGKPAPIPPEWRKRLTG